MSKQNGGVKMEVIMEDIMLDRHAKIFSSGAKQSKEIIAIQWSLTFLHSFQECPTVCEGCMSSLGACITQTIVAHATARRINIDSVTIDIEGIIDLQGFTGLSTDTRPGAQGFRLNVNVKSSTASKEQISQLYEIGKKLSPAFDTLTNGTSVIAVNSSQ